MAKHIPHLLGIIWPGGPGGLGVWAAMRRAESRQRAGGKVLGQGKAQVRGSGGVTAGHIKGLLLVRRHWGFEHWWTLVGVRTKGRETSVFN